MKHGDKMLAVNPYLPSWEYVPDGEPHVYNGRVYVYGSHDWFGGCVYCPGDYVGWSAPEDDLGNWRYEGVIYEKTQDPLNRDGSACLYAPDVTKGPDGRYYLYYVLDHFDVVSVAVSDTPAGKFQFYGYVHYPDGTKLGRREGDEPQFDPGVLTEGDRTYLYTGFCGFHDKTRHGAMCTVLGPDMLTVMEAPVFIAPGMCYADGTDFAHHAFFEAPSIRKIGDVYYFVYSSEVMYELCYATSSSPTGGFRYRGVLSANNDLHIDSYKPAERPMYYGANNHGGLVRADGKWFIFYHRHTNGTSFSRQGCMEQLHMAEDGSFRQAEMTSCCGLSPLPAEGEYPAYIACSLFTREESIYTDLGGGFMDCRFPKITQEAAVEKGESFIANMHDGATAGFRYFDVHHVTGISVSVRGYANGWFELKLSPDGEALCRIPVHYTDIFTSFSADCVIPDGIQSIYLTYAGPGTAQLRSFAFRTV